MTRNWLAVMASVVLIFPAVTHGQISGVQTVPGTYPTLTAAVAAINAGGIGSGGATINVAAGYTETLSAPLVLTIGTNTSSSSNPLVIQKSGSGANPLLTAYTGTGTLDGIVIINGADYITFDGIDLQENAANVTTTTQMEWGFALVKSAANNGSQYNTFKNGTVTLDKTNVSSAGVYLGNHTSVSVTGLTISSISGTSSFNRFYNNTITNCYTGYSITGYAALAPYDFFDQGNQVGTDGVSTRRNQVTNFGGAATTANGILATNQNGLKIFRTYINSTGGTNSTGTMNGINTTGGTNSNVDIYNDTIMLAAASASGSTVVAINNTMGGTGAGSTVNIYNNVVDGCTYTTNTSGIFRGIASTSTASYTNIYNNKVTNNSIPGTGDFAAIFYNGSSATLCLVVNINDNTVSNNTKTGAGGIFYMAYASGSTVTTNFYNNLLFANSATASSGAFYGYYNFAVGYNENVYNNQVYNNSGGSGENAMLYVRSGAGPTNKEIYGNTIFNITGNTTTNFAAIWSDYGATSNIYNNNVYNITNNSASGTAPAVCGIWVGVNSNNLTNVYNNFVSEIKAPSASNTQAVYGIYLQGSATFSVINAYYNTVYLNATSTGLNFGTTAMMVNSLAIGTEIRNNILVNVSTPAGTGLTRAITRTSTTLTNYSFSSGHNCLYAGTPGASNLIFSDGTNNDQTLQAYKNRVGYRDQASFTELPPFVNIAAAPYNLHLQTGIATQCESGGKSIPGFTLDYDAATRGTTPDVGADEITGIMTDIASPDIQYTLLGNSAVAATRTLASFATITDPSGINSTSGTRPRIYYKRSTNANTYNNNTNATDGWKYVEASNTSSPFSFTINYSLLFGGGVVAGDIIQYFVTAQDLNATPRIGLNNGGYTTQPASVNLAAANFPLNNTINQYTILAGALSGTINVGPSEVITSLTNAGGIFQAINAGALSGNLTINITGDLTAETGTFALNQWAEEGAGNYTVTILPSAAVVRNITGSNAANPLIRFDGADRVTVDGRFGGNGMYLRFLNTSNAAPTIGYINDAKNNTLQYSIIESGNTTTSATLGGTILIGTTTGTEGNDNNTITFCEIRDRSDVAGTSPIAINANGTTTTYARYNDNCVISNNNIHDWFLLNSASQLAVSLGSGNSGFTISGNSFYQTTARTNTVSGAITRAININFTSSVANNGGHIITGNFIGGSAPGATGSDMVLNVSGAGTSHTFTGITVVNGLIPTSIQGNVIRKIDYTSFAPTGPTTMWSGISLTQGVFNVGTISGNTIGDATGNDHIKITINAGGASNSFLAGIFASGVTSTFNIQNNTVGGITVAGTTVSGGIIAQWIQLQGTPYGNSTISNNLIGSTATAGSIRNNAPSCAYTSFGIRTVTTSGAGATISNNTIRNLTDNSTTSTSVSYGILATSTAGSQGTLNINNNTLGDISINAGAPTPVLLNIGISIQNIAGVTHSISGNTISGIHSVNTGFFASYCTGIQVQSHSLGGVMSKNRIYNMTNANTGPAPGIGGIYISSGMNWSVSNNMISISNGSNTNNIDLTGISDVMGTNAIGNYNYNSIYLGGTVTAGANNSYPYVRYSNNTATLKNNLLVNNRTGGTGSHAAIGNISAAPGNGWGANVSNYNAFIVSDTTKVGVWITTTYNMSGLRSISGSETNSIFTNTATVTPAALFVNTTTGDLHINTSTYPGGMGTPVSGLTVDYDNSTRHVVAPTIGADEIPCPAPVFTVSTQTNNICNGGTTGTATVTGSGGTGYTFSWSPSGGTAATATGLAAGTYTINITNTCGSNGSVSVTITEPTPVTATSTTVNVTCNGANDGSATVTPAGGTPGYSYAWAPSGGTAATASGLAPGTYTCTITDANSCSATHTVTITEPAVLAASAASQTNILCNGGNNGDATVAVTGGTTSYSYNWLPSGGTAATASGLTAGTYTCNVTDANGCTASQTFTITEPAVLAASAASQTDILCNGGNNGDATVAVTGGTTSYSYNWLPSGGTAATASGLTAGTYTCNVTDANGCTASQTFTITEPAVLAVSAASQTDILCNGGNNGDATVAVTGGTTSYSYNWLPSGGTAATASGLTAGTYTCNVTDANGCTASQTFTITEPAVLTASAASQTDILCNGGNNGDATVAVTGGTTSYSYNWLPSGGSAATASGLTAGTYTCNVTDANGCTTSQTFTITEPAVLAASVTTATNPTTCTGNDGAVDITVSGGTTGYTFAWSNGPTTEDISGVPSGSYTVNITDANGCTTSTSATLTDPNAPTVTVALAVDTVCQPTQAPFTLTGGSPSGGTFTGTGVNANVFDPLQAALGQNIITYTYTDGNGCSASATDSIYVDPCTGIADNVALQAISLYPNPNSGTFTISALTSGTLTIYNSIGQLIYSEQVNTGSKTLALATAESGVYYIRFIDAQEQVKQLSFVIQR